MNGLLYGTLTTLIADITHVRPACRQYSAQNPKLVMSSVPRRCFKPVEGAVHKFENFCVSDFPLRLTLSFGAQVQFVEVTYVAA